MPNPWRRQQVIKNFTISLPSKPFLGLHPGFHIFFHNSFLQNWTFFTAALFWIRPILFWFLFQIVYRIILLNAICLARFCIIVCYCLVIACISTFATETAAVVLLKWSFHDYD